MLQIIGVKSCTETRKALRFCKERSIAHQFVDLKERALSEGEWQKIFQALEPASLIDEQGSFYAKQGYAWRAYDPEEELRAHPQLLKTPLLKTARKIVAGCDDAFLLSQQENR